MEGIGKVLSLSQKLPSLNDNIIHLLVRTLVPLNHLLMDRNIKSSDCFTICNPSIRIIK